MGPAACGDGIVSSNDKPKNRLNVERKENIMIEIR
jgi:hypothetical protein